MTKVNAPNLQWLLLHDFISRNYQAEALSPIFEKGGLPLRGLSIMGNSFHSEDYRDKALRLPLLKHLDMDFGGQEGLVRRKVENLQSIGSMCLSAGWVAHLASGFPNLQRVEIRHIGNHVSFPGAFSSIGALASCHMLEEVTLDFRGCVGPPDTDAFSDLQAFAMGTPKLRMLCIRKRYVDSLS